MSQRCFKLVPGVLITTWDSHELRPFASQATCQYCENSLGMILCYFRERFNISDPFLHSSGNEILCKLLTSYRSSQVPLSVGDNLVPLQRYYGLRLGGFPSPRCELVAFGKYPKAGPSSLILSHHARIRDSLPASAASSAYQT